MGRQLHVELHLRRNAWHQGVFIRIKSVGIERVLQGIVLDARLREILDLCRDMQRCLRIGAIQVGYRLEVSHVHLRFRR